MEQTEKKLLSTEMKEISNKNSKTFYQRMKDSKWKKQKYNINWNETKQIKTAINWNEMDIKTFYQVNGTNRHTFFHLQKWKQN